jgi:DnaJ-class molecular chaperone
MKKGFLDGYNTYDDANGRGNPDQWKNAFYTRMSLPDAQAILSGQPQTPHEILGVPIGATKEQIRKAFRKLMMEWHPDHNAHRLAEATEMSKKILAAYAILE